ncbi:MAG: hypothetical protein AB7U20_24545 [Planctomycetaceae bacterium]
MLRDDRQTSTLLPIVIAALFSGCQSANGLVRPIGGDQTRIPEATRPAAVAGAPIPHAAIRPGYSWDVDDPNVLTVAGQQPVDQQIVPDGATARRGAEPPMDPVPPSPSPPKDAASRLAQTGSPPKNIPARLFESDVRLKSVYNKEQDPSTREPTSPDLASPFSLRSLYSKLRFRRTQSEAPVAEFDSHRTSAVSGEFGEAGDSNSAGAVVPVALGVPEADLGSAVPRSGSQLPGVEQASPSCFRCPLWADAPRAGALVPQ